MSRRVSRISSDRRSNDTDVMVRYHLPVSFFDITHVLFEHNKVYRYNAITVNGCSTQVYFQVPYHSTSYTIGRIVDELTKLIESYVSSAKLRSLEIRHHTGIINLADFDISLREIIMKDCSPIVQIPDDNSIRRISIETGSSNIRTFPIDIELGKCMKLETLRLSGSYNYSKLQDPELFHNLSSLRKITIKTGYNIAGNVSNYIKLPYLEYCTKLQEISIDTKEIPKPWDNHRDSSLMKLCQLLRKEPINRLIDIVISLKPLRLPTYVIFWIVEWLPQDDWVSAHTKRLYHGRKIPHRKLKEYDMINIIRNINESRKT